MLNVPGVAHVFAAGSVECSWALREATLLAKLNSNAECPWSYSRSAVGSVGWPPGSCIACIEETLHLSSTRPKRLPRDSTPPPASLPGRSEVCLLVRPHDASLAPGWLVQPEPKFDSCHKGETAFQRCHACRRNPSVPIACSLAKAECAWGQSVLVVVTARFRWERRVSLEADYGDRSRVNLPASSYARRFV